MLDGDHNRVIRVLVFIVNFILLLPMAIAHLAVGPVIAAIVILAVLFLDIFLGDEDFSATWYLPNVLVADIAVFVTFHFSTFRKLLDLAALPKAFAGLGIAGWIVLAAGVALCIVGFAFSNLRFLTAIGGALAGMAVTLTSYSNADLKDFAFLASGRSLTILYLTASALLLLWALIMGAAEKWDPDIAVSVKCLLLHVLYLVFITVETDYVGKLSPAWDKFLAAVPETLGSWQFALPVVLVTLVLTVIFYFAEDEFLCIDSYTLVYVITVIAAEWVVSDAGIPVLPGQVGVLLLVVGVFAAFCADMQRDKMFSLDCEKYLFAQFGVFLIAVFFLWFGFWTNLIATALFAVYFYLYKTNKKVGERTRLFWYMIPLAISLEAAACMWIKDAPASAYLTVVMMLAVCEAALRIFTTPHPDGRNIPKSCRIAVCTCCGVLCLLATWAVW